MPILCLLSGLSPEAGPGRLLDHEHLDTVSITMATEMLSYNHVSLSLENLISIVSSALELTLPPRKDRSLYDRAPNFPDGVSDWEYFDCLGIGYFDEYGQCPCDDQGRGPLHPDENNRFPLGNDVQLRRINEYNINGYFYGVKVDDPDAPDGSGVRTEDQTSYCGTGLVSCNFFIMRGCFEYLCAWLNPSVSQRVAFLDAAPSMTLQGELYEIVNSRHGRRARSGLLPGIEYGDITKTLEDYQRRFLKARKGSKYTSHAINAGLRGIDLLPAIFRDFQCWLSMRPDIWPSPTVASPTPKHKRFPTSLLPDPFSALPTELLLIMFSQLPMPTLFTLSAASRNLRALITEPAFLNQTIKAAVLTGSAFWILPVTTIAGEEERAQLTAMEWLATVSSENSALDMKSPFHSVSFPYFAFVHACYESESMRNRERFWNIVKQFDELWRDYRLHGWQQDVFVH